MASKKGSGPKNIVVFAGKHDDGYVDDVCALLECEKGELVSKNHTDSDPYMQLVTNVGGRDVYLVLRYHKDTMSNLGEMLFFANAALHEGARSVRVVETYMGCSRQERKSKAGEAVTLQVKANCIMANGIDEFVTFAAHADASILAFDPSRTRFRNIPLWPPMIQVISNIVGDDAMVKSVGPDAGAAKFVREVLDSTTVKEDERFSKDLAIVDKDRVHQIEGTVKSGAVIGDVRNQVAALFDDESVTFSTMANAAYICRDSGAVEAYTLLAHPKFAMDDQGTAKLAEALEKRIIQKVIVSNSCYLPPDIYGRMGLEEGSDRLVIIPTQPLVAEYIERSAIDEGVPYLYSSRGVLKPYRKILHDLENAETRERNAEYERRFQEDLNLYNRLAAPILGPFRPVVGSHKKLVEAHQQPEPASDDQQQPGPKSRGEPSRR